MEGTQARPAHRAAPPLVLIVDDNADARDICTRILEAAGYRTATATSGAEALASLEKEVPGLVVLDLSMPEMDGFTAAHMIRKQPRTARLPVLVLTGLSANVEEAARRAGGTAFVTKPIDPARLLAAVRRLCPL
jgi:two-component system chemotaxis response regulator CheY